MDALIESRLRELGGREIRAAEIVKSPRSRNKCELKCKAYVPLMSAEIESLLRELGGCVKR